MTQSSQVVISLGFGGNFINRVFLNHWDFLNLDLLIIILSEQKESLNKNWGKGRLSQAVKNAIFLTKLFKPLHPALLKALLPWILKLNELVNSYFCLSKFDLCFYCLKTKNSWLIQVVITVLQIYKLKIEVFRNDHTQRNWLVLMKFKRDWYITQNNSLISLCKYLKYSHLSALMKQTLENCLCFCHIRIPQEVGRLKPRRGFSPESNYIHNRTTKESRLLVTTFS